ncbi:MAG: SPOR domain-containing protein, partial [Thermodesulfobacteriota bacterium]
MRTKLLAALLVVALAGAGAYLYLGQETPPAEPQLVSKRIKIEVPPGPTPTQPTPAKPAPAKPAPAEPVPAKPEPVKPEPIAKTPEKPKPAPPEPAPKKTAKTAVAPAKKPWAVNVASFISANEANKLRDKLRKAGYNAYTTEFIKDGRKWHRLRTGFYATKDEAGRAGKRISEKFGTTSAWIVKPSAAEANKYRK